MKRFFLFMLIVLMIMITGCDNNSTGNNKAPEPPYAPSPNHGATNVANATTLQWTCYDADGDDLTYSIYLGKGSMTLVATGLKTNSYSPDILDYSTDYSWKVEASDGHSTTKSPQWNFRTVAMDIAPTSPTNPQPANNITDIEVDQILRWYCYDLNGDPLTFDVRLGLTETPPLIATNLVNFQFSVSNLDYHTMYYWQVIVKSTDKETVGPLWCFETRYYNYPPDIPNNPLPLNNSVNVSTHANLSWRCEDPELDPLSYDIYLGTDNNPPLVEQGHIYSSFSPENQEPMTDYYWRIVAWDGTNYTHGPIWHFVTGNPNSAPNAPSLPWPADGAQGESIYAMLRWSCSDPDGDNLVYKVYFGTTPQLDEGNVIALGISDASWELGTLNYNRTYYWKITAHDGELGVTGPTWSFTTENYR
ncbi:MAG: hypothetical protein K9N06_01260 [Candidatus Cloacimonetes bacterium]|nr:hypothetical protein [Candidatus Cloacimonadota bacterium]